MDRLRFRKGEVKWLPIQSVANDVNFFSVIDLFRMPQAGAGQIIEWYLKNEGTGEVIGIDWNLWITPKSMWPKV